jgi:bacterioferritin-associated ferredoxin
MVSLDVSLLKTIFSFRMYVCVCEAVTDHEIRKAVEDGASSIGDVMACTRAGTRCGTCRTELARLVDTACPAACRRRLDVVDAYGRVPAKAA